MTPQLRRWIFLIAGLALVAFYLWGLSGLPGFGNYPGPYGFAILRVAVTWTPIRGETAPTRKSTKVAPAATPTGRRFSPILSRIPSATAWWSSIQEARCSPLRKSRSGRNPTML